MIKELIEAIKRYDVDASKNVTQQAIDSNVNPKDLIDSIKDAMKNLGAQLNEGEKVFFPQMLLAYKAVDAALKIIDSRCDKELIRSLWSGTIVLGTVEGDWNDLGLYSVAFSFMSTGFRVYNLGVSVPARVFVDKALEVDADIIGLSCLLWSQIYKMRDVMDELKARGLRKRFKVLVGGGGLLINVDWPQRIGADGAGVNSLQAIRCASRKCPVCTGCYRYDSIEVAQKLVRQRK